jgi:hypothetical protein
LAKRADDLVSDYITRDLEHAYAGEYLRTELVMRFGILHPLMGWAGGRVACYLGDVFEDNGRRVVVTLFGSASNVVGYRDDGGTGFYPSDLHGLYTLLNLVREPSDPDMDPNFLWDDGRLGDEVRASAAMTLARGAANIPLGPQDFLARLFVDVDDHDFSDGTRGRVLLGAPLWVATPLPEPM